MHSGFCNKIQACLGAAAGLAPGHCKNANIAIKQVVLIFCFPSALWKECLPYIVVCQVHGNITLEKQCIDCFFFV